MKAAGIISVLIAIYALVGCTTRHNQRVEAAYALATTEPTTAIDSIAAIDTLQLSKPDRMLLRLANIKATDKAYLPLPTDSAALSLVDYYSRHETKRFYPEALYYAGRTYRESGDYPTALRYYQDALDLLPENTPNQTLRAAVLSQTAAILANLRLFEQAERYFYESLAIDTRLKDSVNIIYDIENLAKIKSQQGKHKESLVLSLQSDSLTESVFPENIPNSKSNLAYSYYLNGNINNALILLEEAKKPQTPIDLSEIFSNVTTIYFRAGLIDSTFKYANKLVELENIKSKRNGYYYLLRKELSELVDPDSISAYVTKYLLYTEKLLSQNSNQETIIQNSYYNYSTHERKRIAAEKEKDRMTRYSLILAIVVCILTVVLLRRNYRNQTRKLKLEKALNDIQELRAQIAHPQPLDDIKQEDNTKATPDLENLREELRQKIISAAQFYDNDQPIPEQIGYSKEYIELTKLLKNRKKITDIRYWNDLKMVVYEAYPELCHNLSILAEGEPRIEDLRTILLIKCGFSPSELGILLGLSKGAISSRRIEISKRLFREKYPLKLIDNAIRLL